MQTHNFKEGETTGNRTLLRRAPARPPARPPTCCVDTHAGCGARAQGAEGGGQGHPQVFLNQPQYGLSSFSGTGIILLTGL